MRKVLVITGLILIWMLFVTTVFVTEEWLKKPPVLRGDIASIKNHLVQKLNEAAIQKRVGSAALVLVQKGEISGEYGFGIANLQTNNDVKTGQSLYLVASVSKAITAWGVMKLVQEGRLTLDEPVIRHLKRWRFPGSEAYKEKVTARHLLSHTSGIDDGFGYSGFLPGELLQTAEESLIYPKDANMGKAHPAFVVREPGKIMSYSTAGYTVLQLLIEEITNRPFSDYMKETVLQPLGMTRAGYDLDAIIAEGRTGDLVTNYDMALQPHPHRRYANMSGVSLRVTPHDLGQFIKAYYKENPVLRKETLKQMVMPQPGTFSTWGLGHEIFVENNAGGHVVGHGGGAFPRTGASMRVNPATGNGIAIMMTGGHEMINPYVDDWMYWETGKIVFDIRNAFHRRIKPALILICLGALGIILRRSKKVFQLLKR